MWWELRRLNHFCYWHIWWVFILLNCFLCYSMRGTLHRSPAMMTFFWVSCSECMSAIWRDIFGLLYAATSLVSLFPILRQIAVFVIELVWTVSRLWISFLCTKIVVPLAGASPLTSGLLVVYVKKFGSLNVLLPAKWVSLSSKMSIFFFVVEVKEF